MPNIKRNNLTQTTGSASANSAIADLATQSRSRESWSLLMYGPEDREPIENLGCYSVEAINFLNSIIRYDPAKRPEMHTLLSHDYFKVDLD